MSGEEHKGFVSAIKSALPGFFKAGETAFFVSIFSIILLIDKNQKIFADGDFGSPLV